MNIRLHPLYPGFIFRAAIDFKNVALKADKWAEGPLFRDDLGHIFIFNNKAGNGTYTQDPILTETLGMGSGFCDCNEKEIFEGDIVRFKRFVRPDADVVTEDDERAIYDEVPEGCPILASIEGVAFLQGGVFFVQYYSEELGFLTCLPMGMFFAPDGHPAEDVVANVAGNIYDNEILYEKVLHLHNSESHADMMNPVPQA
ncbi:MAG: YopX family protein [Huintestinicola sp.]